MQKSPIIVTFEQWPQGMPVDPGPDNRDTSPDSEELLSAAMNFAARELSLLERFCLVCRYLDGKNWREIGEDLGFTPSQVHGALKRGVGKLRLRQDELIQNAQDKGIQ